MELDTVYINTRKRNGVVLKRFSSEGRMYALVQLKYQDLAIVIEDRRCKLTGKIIYSRDFHAQEFELGTIVFDEDGTAYKVLGQSQNLDFRPVSILEDEHGNFVVRFSDELC